MKRRIEVKQLGPRQQFVGTNGLRQKLASKEKALRELAALSSKK